MSHLVSPYVRYNRRNKTRSQKKRIVLTKTVSTQTDFPPPSPLRISLENLFDGPGFYEPETPNYSPVSISPLPYIHSPVPPEIWDILNELPDSLLEAPVPDDPYEPASPPPYDPEFLITEEREE